MIIKVINLIIKKIQMANTLKFEETTNINFPINIMT